MRKSCGTSDITTVVFGLKHFDRDSLEWLKEEGPPNATSSRSLAIKLCTQMNWKNQAGNLCVDQALEVLPKIEEYLQVSRPHNPSTPRPASPRCPVPSRSDKKSHAPLSSCPIPFYAHTQFHLRPHLSRFNEQAQNDPLIGT